MKIFAIILCTVMICLCGGDIIAPDDINSVYSQEKSGPECIGDANGGGAMNVAAAVYLINDVFKGSPNPAEGYCGI